jgi:hypothetical protein
MEKPVGIKNSVQQPSTRHPAPKSATSSVIVQSQEKRTHNLLVHTVQQHVFQSPSQPGAAHLSGTAQSCHRRSRNLRCCLARTVLCQIYPNTAPRPGTGRQESALVLLQSFVELPRGFRTE